MRREMIYIGFVDETKTLGAADEVNLIIIIKEEKKERTVDQMADY